MTSRKRVGNGRDRPQDARELREEIERTRGEVGRTTEALAARADVPGRARRRTSEVTGRARQRLAEGPAALRHKREEWRDRPDTENGDHGSFRDAAGAKARDAAQAAGADRKRIVLVCAASAVVAGRILLGVRRRRYRRRSGE